MDHEPEKTPQDPYRDYHNANALRSTSQTDAARRNGRTWHSATSYSSSSSPEIDDDTSKPNADGLKNKDQELHANKRGKLKLT